MRFWAVVCTLFGSWRSFGKLCRCCELAFSASYSVKWNLIQEVNVQIPHSFIATAIIIPWHIPQYIPDISRYIYDLYSLYIRNIKKYPCQDTCPGIPPSKMNGWAHFHPFRHGAGVAAAAASAASARRRPATRCFRQRCGARQGGARADGRRWAREDPDSGWPNRWTLINGLLHFRILEFPLT